MKMAKSLLLGSAAGVVAVGGAQAADLPVKAKPVEYVKICSLYGDGFFYIPGTETCVRIGGSVMWDFFYNARGGGHLCGGRPALLFELFLGPATGHDDPGREHDNQNRELVHGEQARDLT